MSMRDRMIDEISRILVAAETWTADDRLSDPGAYALGYGALRSLFETKLDFENVDDIRAGGYAVYGWMPKILRRWAPDETLLQLGKLAIMARTRPRAEVRQAIGQKFRAERSPLRAFNGSAVGSSKFLHFAAPEVFPIWDSVVAGNFGIEKQSEIARQSNYVDYFDAIHACLEDNPKTRSRLLPLALPNVSLVRSLEYFLFLHGLKEIAAGRRQPTMGIV
jgi:hypothetical protein